MSTKKFIKLASKLYPLKYALNELKPKFVNAIQKVYDEWEQDEFGNDIELGTGGICQDIADAISQIIVSHINCEIAIQDNNGMDEQHVWVTAYTDDECYDIDIPPYIYETGGGYDWKKIPDIIFNESHIIIQKAERPEADY